jgi:hypothetical protein
MAGKNRQDLLPTSICASYVDMNLVHLFDTCKNDRVNNFQPFTDPNVIFGSSDILQIHRG